MYGILAQPPDRPSTGSSLFGQSVRAGFPSPASDYIEDTLDFNHLLAGGSPATFVLRADGESMLGAGIFPGDLLIVDRSLDPRIGDVVIAAIDGEFTVKRLRREDGSYVLVPENPSYPVVAVDGESELSIWGVVTWVLHALRRSGGR